MPRKRIRRKNRKTNYSRLTRELYEAICNECSMEELLGGFKETGIIDGRTTYMFDKNDIDVSQKIWNNHSERVMSKWRRDPKANAGRRPYLWWKVEAPEPKGGENELKYLKRLNLLEDWEKEELGDNLE